MGTTDPKKKRKRKTRDYSKEVKSFRAMLRAKQYLSNPEQNNDFTSLTGKKLHSDLLQLSTIARNNKSLYVDAFSQCPWRPKAKLQHVPVTKEEWLYFSGMATKTKAELAQNIMDKINLILDISMKDSILSTWQQLKTSSKTHYIDFYNKIDDLVLNATVDSGEEMSDLIQTHVKVN